MAHPTDYPVYREIMEDLLAPIEADHLDERTRARLYQSKLVYLENLRVRCFHEMNSCLTESPTAFSRLDYHQILLAISRTQSHLHELVLAALLRRL